MGTDLKKRTPMQEVCETIAGERMAEQIRQALPSNVSQERFVRVTLTAVQQNPDLIEADKHSLYQSIVRCAQDGLLPDGREAALVIFKDKKTQTKHAQYLPMIGGLRKVAAKHGIRLSATVVHEHDEFFYELGLEPKLVHVPPPLGESRGKVVGAYAIARDVTSGQLVADPEVMDRDEIEQTRKVSRATSEYGPWVQWWGEMARKTVAKRLFKQLPLPDLDEADTQLLAAADADADFGDRPRMSVEEANVSAAIGTAIPEDDGPNDIVSSGEGVIAPVATAQAAPTPETSQAPASPELFPPATETARQRRARETGE